VWQCSGKGERLAYERTGFESGLWRSFFLAEKRSTTVYERENCGATGAVMNRRQKKRSWEGTLPPNPVLYIQGSLSSNLTRF